MTARSKTKTKASPAAQSSGEVSDLIKLIGEKSRELARLQADLGDEIARVKEEAETKALPIKAAIDDAQSRIHAFCEAHRDELTKGGKTKTVEFTTGSVKWRLRPSSVKVRGVDAVIELLREKFDGKFLRTKYEIDKDAMLADVDAAKKVPGITVGSEGEDFVIEPFEADLASAA